MEARAAAAGGGGDIVEAIGLVLVFCDYLGFMGKK
jgi:hypothetical protein